LGNIYFWPKTTAQKVGFVSISKNTLSRVDELMVIQYLDGGLKTLYYRNFSGLLTSEPDL
jgi:hypothetical protein